MKVDFLQRKCISIYIVIICLFLFKGELKAQMLQNHSTVELIKKGIDHIYNLEFDSAEEILNKLNSDYPGHPATFMFKGLMIYWQNYPLTPLLPVYKGFEYQLHTCMLVCESQKGWMDDPEKLLLDLCARGLLMLFYSENDMSGEIYPMAGLTYKCIRKSFQFTSVYADFNYFTGLYNYYREAYPEHHPVYKAIAFLFPQGDKEKGLEELRNAAENSIFLKAESYSILSWICMHYENNYRDALFYSRTLFEKYSSNLTFRGEYLKNLLLLRNYDEAEKIIQSAEVTNNAYFLGQMDIFKGLIREKRYHDYTLAENLYNEGIRYMKTLGDRGEDYRTYGEDGLKRIRNLKAGKEPGKKRREKDTSDFNDLSFDS
jgi:hypothetical protein